MECVPLGTIIGVEISGLHCRKTVTNDFRILTGNRQGDRPSARMTKHMHFPEVKLLNQRTNV
jgi:hypothetical protein